MAATMVITATFPLGVYLGHGPDGQRSDFPDTARLHAALLNAAGQGSLAVEEGGQLRPSPTAVEALRWLESHPPTGLAHPQMVPLEPRLRTLSWRVEGVLESKTSPVERRVRKAQSDGVAVAGALAWLWSGPVPDEVRSTLDALCADVSCLGEAHSPAVLEVLESDEWKPTHTLEAEESGFPAPGGLRVRTPLAGRTDDLEADYSAAYPAKRPSAAADRHSWGQVPSSYVPSSSHVRSRVYRTTVPEAVDAPWSQVVVFRTAEQVDLSDTVRWAVTMHRALVAHLGDAAPSLVTGRYQKGVAQPANRLAVQVALPHPLRSADLYPKETLVLLMVPRDARPDDLGPLHRVVAGVRRLYSREGAVSLQNPEVADGDSFWTSPAVGMKRLWRPYPSVVPEIRRLPSRHGRPWTLEDAGALSVGFLLREAFGTTGASREERYRSLAAALRARGVRWHETHLLREGSPERHVHRAPRDLVVQPFSGLADVGRLIAPQTVFALGQSRHLGGGLMVPEDIPEPLARQRGML